MNKKSIRDIDVRGKRCLVRVDFNVPMKDGKITDENRIRGALPTIQYLTEHGAKSHSVLAYGQTAQHFERKSRLDRKSTRLNSSH